MSNSELENSGDYSHFYHSEETLNSLNISTISKYSFLNDFHFLCNNCETIPKDMILTKINKIIVFCSCQNSPIEIGIHDFIKNLFSNHNYNIPEKLMCKKHNEKFAFYCDKCQINLCKQCKENCSGHSNRINSFTSDKNIINKKDYILIIIKEKEKKEHLLEGNNNTLNFDNNDFYKRENLIVIKKNEDNSNNVVKEGGVINSNSNVINNNSEDKLKVNSINSFSNNYEEDLSLIEKDDVDFKELYYFLFNIILNDYINYPNFNHIKIISKIEDYLTYSYDNYKEIELNYKFNDLKYNDKIHL